MFKIGILGTENSHAMAFAEIFNGYKPEYKDAFADIRVVAAGGNYPEESRKVFEKCGLDTICENPMDMLGRVDAVMVTARDGAYHAPFVEPFIRAGIPAFIDKPFTRDPEQALALARLAKEKRVPLAGGSSVKMSAGVQKLRAHVAQNAGQVLGGSMIAPVSMINDYGGFWFYSAHLAESSLAAFGDHPRWVWANQNGSSLTAIAHYDEYDVTNHFMGDAYNYAGSVFTKGSVINELIDISDIYALECRSFAKMLRTGEMDYSYEQLVRPVFYLRAIEDSIKTGEKQEIPEIEV